MDFRYNNSMNQLGMNQIAQISTMDYWSLVNLLMNNITAETRAIVLNRLVEMNNSLLNITRPQTPQNKTFTPTMRQESTQPKKSRKQDIDIDDLIDSVVANKSKPKSMQNQKQNSKPDDLDAKLARIKKLHNNITSKQNKNR